ncbi:FMN-binding glutamate synthase family protein [Gammaproteobacteria bacterium]|nr:FMN-binding glutamate synthase family protein [Gammaproteobacteria bacterium]
METIVQSLLGFADLFLSLLGLVIAGALGILMVTVVWMYISDISQSQQTIRRNYPVLGRFRYIFEHLGEFFRQYFFALDREELPFNRAQRSWVYRAAKNEDSTIAFGSTQPQNIPGEFIFLNGLFPPLEEEIEHDRPIIFGSEFSRHSYSTNSFFNISGMSFGALSGPAVEALSKGASKAGIWLNTGEGSISPFHMIGECDLVFQMGTAKYGLRNDAGRLDEAKLKALEARDQVKMIEVKLSQGAKPGKGGILPGIKVDEVIASTRGIPVGADSISPNRHAEVKSISDLLDFIKYVRDCSGKPTGIKCVIGQTQWLDEFCQRIVHQGLEFAPDFITVDSGDGGTGAAPLSLMDHTGLPIKRSLPIVVDKLMEYGLRERIRIIASGRLVNPADVAAALCLGADCVNSARGFMFALGCIQSLQCNKNTCPTGIATQNRSLQKGLDPVNKSERVANYALNLIKEVETIAHSCGVAHPNLLERKHAQMIDERGIPQPLDQIYSQISTR